MLTVLYLLCFFYFHPFWDFFSGLHIGDGAFSGCDSLTTLEIPDSVRHVGAGAFSGCDSLTTLEIPDSVTSIGDDAFRYCKSLTTLEIPNSVRHIGEKAFYYCESLIITLTEGSYVHEYALKNDMDFVFE